MATESGPQKGIELKAVDGSQSRIAIISTRWNEDIVSALVKGVQEKLTAAKTLHVEEHVVPGAFELPFAAKSLIQKAFLAKKPYTAVICVGVLIKGETMHFDYISESVSHGIMNAGLETGTPVIFGVLTCLTLDQAKSRAGLIMGSHNHGHDWAHAAIEMGKYKFEPHTRNHT